MAINPALRQVSNRNFLSPVGFKLKINKCPKVDFLATQANLPGITLGTAVQTNPYKDLDVPGDKIVYDDFRVSFVVDEEMENYKQIYKWMIGLGYPNSQRDFTDMKLEDVYHPEIGDRANPYAEFSDGTLQILNSNLRPQSYVKIESMFPVSLSTLDFDASNTDINYFQAQVVFKYQIFQLLDKDFKEV